MRRRWLLLPVLGIAGYFAVFGGEYSLLDLRRLSRERAAQERAAQATRKEVAVLRSRADSLERDSLALERLAREKYGLIRPGERLYRFADGVTTAPRPAPPVRPDSPAADTSWRHAPPPKPTPPRRK